MARFASYVILYTICSAIVSTVAGLFSFIPISWVGWALPRTSQNTMTVGLAISSVAALILSALISLPAATALARFALRTYPINLSISGTKFHLGLVVALSLGILGYGFSVDWPTTLLPPSASEGNTESFVLWCVELCLFSAMTGLWFGAIAIAINTYGRNTNSPERPYVLFLRRFSTFSDRVLIAEIIKATPSGMHCAFITSPGTSPANWDFFTWAFAGLRFMHPIRDIPLHFQTSDLWWTHHVEELIKNAACIVFDETAKSASMEIERELISRNADLAHCVYLRMKNTQLENRQAGMVGNCKVTIEYRKTYVRALVGIVIRLSLVAGIGLYLDLYHVNLFSQDSVLGLQDLGQIPNWLLLTVCSAMFIVHPVISRADKVLIRNAIRAAIKTHSSAAS